ncbi:unnamed protein product [Darwinula stevensoni]|uniref:Poly(A) RNA polymerase mitochondrial-like central palm domain-containing protein n=1 Tax=Darwinula stevensoni TaxID=69355 RepID=A0A7R9A9H7_9CRUS|nr:unnamed protein product [Darwinula stevensoni]CAG0897386.1 unnamed protein product [Darwinula stevensoni]
MDFGPTRVRSSRNFHRIRNSELLSDARDALKNVKKEESTPNQDVIGGIKPPVSSVLVEYESHEGFEALSKAAVFPTTSSPVMALPSHFLWLLGGSKSQTGKSEPKAPSLPIEKFFVPSEVELRERLKPLQMSEQIKELFQYTRLTEAGVRLKYMIACQLEDILSSSFMPLCSVAPFGSSVNGFGKHGCDTDIVIRPTSVEEFGDPQSRLVFETKAVPGNQRLQTQLYLELIGDLLANHVPGCSNIIRILQARVPIVRFNHDLAGTQCDISMDPMGHRMSELLWLCTQVDPRVAPLVFAVRRWAQGVQLTNPAPGRWISNFSLTLLVIFFLQSTSPSILPRLHTLANWAASGQPTL